MKVVLALFFSALLCAAQKSKYQCPTIQQCQDDAAAIIKAFNYATGDEGIERDYEMAAKWYLVAALHEHPAAQADLGELYSEGKGVPQDFAEAFRWYRKAADGGFVRAQAEVGAAYLFAIGVPQDYQAALEWLRKAADGGNSYGQHCLGMMYEGGFGVPQSYIQAHMWFNLAGARGDTGARVARDAVAAKMTPAQIAEAQRLAREFRPKGQ